MKEEHIKVFSGSPVVVRHLGTLLKEQGIDSICKNHHESATLAGFGSLMSNAELFILNIDLEKAKDTIINFREEINS